uniref:Uncharacterized protein n=1 Tax=Salix viminalis TaxID=40686 RepID=A0A6N2M239_SALVM
MKMNSLLIRKNGEHIIDIEERKNLGMRDIICQVDKTTGSRRTWSSPNFGALKIVIAQDDGQRDRVVSCVEATPKEKGYKPFFWKQRCGEHSRAKGSITLFNKLFGQASGLQRQLQTPVHLQSSCSIQLTLALMLSIFLFGCRKKAARRKITVANIFDVLEIQGQENLLYETRVAGLECYFRFHSHRKCACIHLVSNVLQ